MKFKIGDMVIGNDPDRYTYTNEGWVGEVKKVHSDGRIDVYGKRGRFNDYMTFTYLEPQYFDLHVDDKSVKIVITTNGKTTTATLYRENGTKEVATAKCCPEDTFDFNVGAKLAMERLMEKTTEPLVMDGFKIGDRVNRNGINGTIICFSDKAFNCDNYIGVEFDREPNTGHNCGGIHLIAGTTGTKGTSSWVRADEIEKGEAPKYFNGKVICIEKGYGVSEPIDRLTIGKIYNVVNGRLTTDTGYKSCYYSTVNNLCVGLGWKFLEIVE